jgi:DNA-binding MarR family transcriptional regulator
MSNVLITTEQISEKQVNETFAAELAALEQTAKRYLQQFYRAEILDQGILFMPRAVKNAYKEMGMTITEYAVMELLLIHWYQSTGLPEVSLNTLAQELGKSKVQVWRHLKKLQQKGLLTVIHIFDQDGAQRNNRYDISPFVQKLEAFAHQNIYDISVRSETSAGEGAETSADEGAETSAAPTEFLPPVLVVVPKEPENDVQVPVIQKQEETLAPQEKPKASKTKKSSKANKKKKEQSEDVQKQPLDSAEIARKLISIYVHPDTLAHQHHPSNNANVDAYHHPSNNANVETSQQKDTSHEQLAIVDPDRLLRFSAAVTKQVGSAVAFFRRTKSELDEKSAYRLITRIFKKLREIQIIREYDDEDLECDYIALLTEALEYVQEELSKEEYQHRQVDWLADFINALDWRVDGIRQEIAEEWIESLLQVHEEEFPSSPYGIAQPQLLDVPPELAIQNPRSLLALEEVTRYAPTGSMLVRHLHHYGAVQPRRVEYMLMGKYPDPEALKQSQQVLRMSQFNDERKKLQQANPWRITGNTLDLFCQECLQDDQQQSQTQVSEGGGQH